MITKAVITAAGAGTRMLPATYGIPKAMLPIPHVSSSVLVIKPIIQRIFEALYDSGIRDFTVIVGPDDIIQNHFRACQSMHSRPDMQWGKAESFHAKAANSSIRFVRQPSPAGFGDAVLRARDHVGGSEFILHAGDVMILPSPHVKHLSDCIRNGAGAALLVKEVADQRQYGVVRTEEGPKFLKVLDVEEKPRVPRSNLAITGVYSFGPSIMRHLEATRPGSTGQVELTDSISRMLDDGIKVAAVKMPQAETWLDMGRPEGYTNAFVTECGRGNR